MKKTSLDFFADSLPGDKDLALLTHLASQIDKGIFDIKNPPDIFPFHLNDFAKYVTSTNQNDVMYGYAEGRSKVFPFLEKQFGYKGAIKYGHAEVAFVKFDPCLDLSKYTSTPHVFDCSTLSSADKLKLEMLDKLVGLEERNDGWKLLGELFPEIEKKHPGKNVSTWTTTLQKLAAGDNSSNTIDPAEWSNQKSMIVNQAKGVHRGIETNSSKLFGNPGKSIGEQMLVSLLEVCGGLELINSNGVSHVISNLKGFRNIVSNTPLEFDEVFVYKTKTGVTFVPMEVKGIKETLNLSKIFQQYQAFRLKLNRKFSVQCFALTESKPKKGYWKQIELIEFEIHDKYLDAKEGTDIINAIQRVKVKQRHTYSIKK